MLAELGQELSAARKRLGATLESVATPANISVAYLRKLEKGNVNNPSPRVLQRLADVLDVPYNRLMALAGYLIPESTAVPAVLLEQDLSDEEWQAVAAFIRYLKAQRSN